MRLQSFSIGRDWKELRRFESLTINECSIVFYAENKASMNHFKLLILELTEKMNLEICYVTSVKDDPIFLTKNQKIKSFYIGDGAARTKFFLTLKSKIMIMDMPDLNTFHIKRSMTFPVHYVYIFHSMFSIHSYLRKGAIDNYDTIFCVGEHHVNEIRETEKVYGLKPKKLVKYGYGRLDTLINEKKKYPKNLTNAKNQILIVPSYGNENLLDVCGIQLIDILLKSNFKVLLRPHFRTLRDSRKLIKTIKEKFEKNPNFILETGIIIPDLFHNSISMISDWSGISLEYAFTLERPVIFIDVPKKNLNLNFKDIVLEPIEISIRDKIGYVVSPNNLEIIPNLCSSMEKNAEKFNEQIKAIREKTVYHIGTSAKIGAKYIQELNDSP
ncbi:MAG: CDP-glycerol glycerophosphotransferase family protein [Nitrosarchaeum sp.]